MLKSDIAGARQLILNVGTTPINLTQGEQIAVRSPMNGSSTVNIANAPLLFIGYGVAAPERGWDDFKKADVRGKILVVLVNDPDFEGGEGSFGGKAMTYYGRWTYKYEEAARRGAAGVMVVHETEPASYGWATVKNSNTNTMFDIVRANPAAEHTPFESWIQRDLAVRLFQASGLDFEAARIAANAHVRAMKACVPGKREYEIAAEVVHEFRVHNADLSYLPIVGGGANGCILH
jgi:hypothetical protein